MASQYIKAPFSKVRPASKFRCLSVLLLAILAGCASQGKIPSPSAEDAALFEGGLIQVGDEVKVAFPGAPNLNMTQLIRLDGKLNLGPLGDIKVADKTSKEVETELLKLFESELVVKEVNVVVNSAGFPVFVTGAVMRPGRVVVNRSVTVVEALMEAGGFDPRRANLKKVKLLRQENGSQRTLILDVESSLQSPNSRPFHLRPSDIVIVPEKFVFF